MARTRDSINQGKPVDLTSEHPQIMMARTPYLNSNRELLKYDRWGTVAPNIESPNTDRGGGQDNIVNPKESTNRTGTSTTGQYSIRNNTFDSQTSTGANNKSKSFSNLDNKDATQETKVTWMIRVRPTNISKDKSTCLERC